MNNVKAVWVHCRVQCHQSQTSTPLVFASGSYKYASIVRQALVSEFFSQFFVIDNALHAGMKTTIGPASFYLYKLNQYDPKTLGKPGREKKVCTM